MHKKGRGIPAFSCLADLTAAEFYTSLYPSSYKGSFLILSPVAL